MRKNSVCVLMTMIFKKLWKMNDIGKIFNEIMNEEFLFLEDCLNVFPWLFLHN